MKYFSLLLAILSFSSCEIKSNSPLPSSNTTYSTPETPPPLLNHKFGYAIFKVEEPHLEYSSPRYGLYDKMPEIAYVTWKTKKYYSEINEFENFTEDIKYKFLDEASATLSKQPSDFIIDVQTKIMEHDKGDFLNSYNKIVSRDFLIFDSYKDASINKQQSKDSI